MLQPFRVETVTNCVLIRRAAMSAETFIQRVAAPSLCLSDTERHRVSKLCECLKEFLNQERTRFLHRHKSVPILEVYASDGTPLKTVSRHSMDYEELRAVRSGTSSREWIVQRLFLATGGGRCLCALYRALLVAGQNLVDTLRGAAQVGPTG